MRAEIESHVKIYADRLGTLPGMDNYVQLLEQEAEGHSMGEAMKYIFRTYQAYLDLFSALAALSPEDFGLLQQANALRNVTNGADAFLSAIGNHREQLRALAEKACDPSSPLFHAGLNDLHGYMARAANLSQQDIDTKSMPIPTLTLTTWRRNLTAGAMVHFMSYHGAESVLRHGLRQLQPGCLAAVTTGKNFTHLHDLVALQTAQGKADDDVRLMWSTPHQCGGLGWIKDEDQAHFDTVVKAARTF